MQRLFTAADAWTGGFYELAVELATKDPIDCTWTLAAIWSDPRLTACYRREDTEPEEQDRQQPFEPGLKSFGVATLPNGKRCACGTVTIDEPSGPNWLCFFLPMGSLGAAYDTGGYPFGDFEKVVYWQPEIDNWLAQVGQRAFKAVPFALAPLGHEAPGACYASEVLASGVPPRSPFGFLLPRLGQLLVVHAPVRRSDA